MVAESSDVSDIPDDGSAYHSAVEDLESEEESTMSKKQIPLHIKLAKKVSTQQLAYCALTALLK